MKRKTIAESGYQLVIDSCLQCQGIWLERDQLSELDAIQKESWLITMRRVFRFISGKHLDWLLNASIPSKYLSVS